MFEGEKKVETTFLYVLIDPVLGKIRYVGKSDEPFVRYQNHLTDSSTNHRTNWIRSLRIKGHVPHMELLDEVPISEWIFWERAYIRLFKLIGINLVNGTDGGEGLNNPSDDTREKIGLAMAKFHTGKKKSESHRLNISRALMGKKKSPEHCKNLGKAMSIVNTGRRFSKEHRHKLSLAAGRRKANVS